MATMCRCICIASFLDINSRRGTTEVNRKVTRKKKQFQKESVRIAISNFFLLRFICPAIIDPVTYKVRFIYSFIFIIHFLQRKIDYIKLDFEYYCLFQTGINARLPGRAGIKNIYINLRIILFFLSNPSRLATKIRYPVR